MKRIAWELETDSKHLNVYHIDLQTSSITKKERLSFKRDLSFEDAFQYVRANYLGRESHEQIESEMA